MAARKDNPENSKPWSRPFLFLVGLALVAISMGSYNPEDPSLNTFASDWIEPQNSLGYAGSWLADLLFQAMGYMAWLFPVLLGVSLLRFLADRERQSLLMGWRFWLASLVALSGACLSINNFAESLDNGFFPPQGLWGIVLSEWTIPFLGQVGTYFVSLLCFWVFFLLWWEEAPVISFRFMNKVVHLLARAVASIASLLGNASLKLWYKNRQLRQERRMDIAINEAEKQLHTKLSQKAPKEDGSSFLPSIRKPQLAEGKKHSNGGASLGTPIKAHPNAAWQLPPSSLLKQGVKIESNYDKQSLLQTAAKIKSALGSFDIGGEVTEISPGPIITLYEFQPAAGVRVQKIVSASTDLAMALGVASVRIVAPIPGKSVAGIEVPNGERQDIFLRDVFEATTEKAAKQRLPLSLGKDGEGNPITEDLSRMPHLLVGGATNMGKSVLVNSILSSLLLRFSPEDLRLIIVDPKLVEFKIYEDIPHLLLPIVNDPTDASQALKWAVNETRRRYLEMQKVSARNLEGYNEKAAQSDGKLEAFPYIVIIIDELAELMLTAKKDVEQSIVRLSQLARAAGIHLIMATQRPSADVVTGLIKSNCPARAALRVASATDSRIILDTAGAESLLGQGDMFFTNSGPMGLRRMQGAFISDEEVEALCGFWRNQGEPDYQEEILEEKNFDEMGDEDRDALFKEVISFAKEKGSISTSLIQRRFQIGYTRAARIMEQLEAAGIVSEAAAAGKARDVLI